VHLLALTDECLLIIRISLSEARRATIPLPHVIDPSMQAPEREVLNVRVVVDQRGW